MGEADFDKHAFAAELAKTMRCNCDLDNWEPERSTGHSWVCRIHREALAEGQRRAGRPVTLPIYYPLGR